MGQITKAVKTQFKNLDADYLIGLFNQDIELAKVHGYGIYFNGQLIKPKNGKVITYPTSSAAIDALKRNSSFHHRINDQLTFQACGFNYYTDKEAWANFFFKPVNPDGSSNGFKEENYELYRAIEDMSNSALSKMISRWLESGLLEIKLITNNE